MKCVSENELCPESIFQKHFRKNNLEVIFKRVKQSFPKMMGAERNLL